MKDHHEEIRELTGMLLISWAVIIFLLIFMSFRVYV
jgi:hypothetical protein